MNTTITSTYRPCNHDIGWYARYRFLCFTLKLFWCEKCHTLISEKEARRKNKK